MDRCRWSRLSPCVIPDLHASRRIRVAGFGVCAASLRWFRGVRVRTIGGSQRRPRQPVGDRVGCRWTRRSQLALEQNLGIQVERINPQIQDIAIAQARSTGRRPSRRTLTNNSTEQPVHQRVLRRPDQGHRLALRHPARPQPAAADRRQLLARLGQLAGDLHQHLQQLRPAAPLGRSRSTSRSRCCATSRSTTSASSSRSSQKDRDGSDVQLQSTIVGDDAQRQERVLGSGVRTSTTSARRSSRSISPGACSRDNEKRVQIGTMAPIDIVEAQSEVARNEEAVIVAEAAIKQAEDRLRALIFDPASPDFWTIDARADRDAGRSRRRRSTSTAPSARAREPDRRAAGEEQPRARATSTSGTTGTRRCPRSTPRSTYSAVGGRRRAAAAADLAFRSAPIRPRAIAGAARLRLGARRRVHERVPGLDLRRHGRRIRSARARRRRTWRGRGCSTSRRRRSCGTSSCRSRPQVRDVARQVQTNQKRVDSGPRRARAGRAAARSRGEEVRGRHPDQLLRVPGAARPRAGAHQRGPRDRRLQQVARGLRGRPGGAAAGASRPRSSGTSQTVPGATGSAPESGIRATGDRNRRLRPYAGLPEPCPSHAQLRARLVHSPACRSSRSPSSRRNEAADIARGARVGRLGRRDRRRRLPRAPTTPSRSRGGSPSASSSATWPGYVAQKNFAASLASHDWILSLDADERVTPALAARDPAALSRTRRTRRSGCRASPGIWAAGSGATDWYPDHQLRLYDRRAAQWTGQYVHEAVDRSTARSASCAASCSTIAYRDIADHLETIDRYTTLRRAADARERPPRRAAADGRPSAARVPAQLHRCAAASATACPASSSRR